MPKKKDEALGRNPTDRGRTGCKFHLLVDEQGIPINLAIVGANVHDSRLVSATVECDFIANKKSEYHGVMNLCLDKGYDYKRVEDEVIAYGYTPHIRRIGEEKIENSEKIHPARRYVVERTFAWLKGCRSLRTRYCHKATNFLALAKLACAIIIFRNLS